MTDASRSPDLPFADVPSRKESLARVGLPSRETEKEIVGRLLDGDEEALGLILRYYWGGLLRYAEQIVEDRDRAEDVVQDAFVRLWDRRSAWKQTDSIRPLLYRLVRNGALNRRRDRKVLHSWLRRLHRAEELADLRAAPTLHEEVELSELQERAKRAIDALPPRRREIFLLVRQHQLTYREAAEALDIAPQTVANQMSQAMNDLGKALAPYLDESSTRDLPFPGRRTG